MAVDWVKGRRYIQPVRSPKSANNTGNRRLCLSAKMLRVDNQYWASTKYDQLNRLITTARADGEKFRKS